MELMINSAVFTQTDLDSGALTVHGAVVHAFREPGRYEGRVQRNGRTTATFHLLVGEDVQKEQVQIDLATLGAPMPRCECQDEGSEDGPHFQVAPGGYVLFYVSSGNGGYAVRVGRRDQETEEGFDSTRLGEGDMFAATVIRPGRYSLSGVGFEGEGELVVALPKRSREPYRPPEPVTIVCSASGFQPKSVRILAGQGQIYTFKKASAAGVRIELVEPDDRARPPAAERSAKKSD